MSHTHTHTHTHSMAPPPTYSQIIGNKHSHSLSDPSNDNTADGQRWGSNAGEGRREGSLVLSQESQVHLLSDTDSAQGTLDSIRYVSLGRREECLTTILIEGSWLRGRTINPLKYSLLPYPSPPSPPSPPLSGHLKHCSIFPNLSLLPPPCSLPLAPSLSGHLKHCSIFPTSLSSPPFPPPSLWSCETLIPTSLSSPPFSPPSLWSCETLI